MNCKKDGFTSTRHNDLRDLTANMMSKVCKDTETEPKQTPFSWTKLQGRMLNISSEVSVDIRARGLWVQGQQAFFELLVFNSNACHYRNESLQQCHVMNEQEKKRAHNERILNILWAACFLFSIIKRRQCWVLKTFQKPYWRFERILRLADCTGRNITSCLWKWVVSQHRKTEKGQTVQTEKVDLP